MEVEYKAFPISLKEFSVMQELFKSACSLALEYQTFIKRFDTGLLGSEVIGYIATYKRSNEAAAYYGVFPVKLLINRTRLCLVSLLGSRMQDFPASMSALSNESKRHGLIIE